MFINFLIFSITYIYEKTRIFHNLYYFQFFLLSSICFEFHPSPTKKNPVLSQDSVTRVLFKYQKTTFLKLRKKLTYTHVFLSLYKNIGSALWYFPSLKVEKSGVCGRGTPKNENNPKCCGRSAHTDATLVPLKKLT